MDVDFCYLNVIPSLQQQQQQQRRQRQHLLLVSVIVLLTITPGNTILTPGSRREPLCNEVNLKLLCKCTNQNKTLSVPSFSELNIHGTIDRITIENCQNVTIGQNAIENLRSLRHFEINNVENLYLMPDSLTFKGYDDTIGNNNNHHHYLHDYQPYIPSLNILISQTKIVNIDQYAMRGKPAELKFHHVEFNKIQTFAFSSVTKMQLIELHNCTFRQTVATQAFKKIETERFVIRDTIFLTTLQSRTFTDFDVTEEFKITNCHFKEIHPSAFIVRLPKRVEISNCRFDTLMSQCFIIRSRGPITFRQNQFNRVDEQAFSGISLIKEHRAIANQDFLFDGNVLNQLNRNNFYPINRTSFTPKFGVIIVNQSCTCTEIDIWISSNNEWTEHVHCVIDNRKFITEKAIDFKKGSCDLGTSMWIILVSVFTSLLVLLIIVTIIIVIVYRRYKQNKQKELVNRGRTSKGSLGMIVPDGRTYRETEVHVIVEKAELLTTEL